LNDIQNATVAQMVERDLAKVEAVGSSPICRSHSLEALLAMRLICTQDTVGSIPAQGSKFLNSSVGRTLPW
jgi:hypothetical protein